VVRHVYVAGAGYVGLVSAACYAQKGIVYLYEKDQARRETIASAKAPFFEPELNQLLAKLVETACLQIVTDPAVAVAASDLSFVAVGTPVRRDGYIDTSQVLAACRDIGRGLRIRSGYHVVVIRSTVFPGTTSGLVLRTLERSSGKKAGEDFGLVAYPEFLREGSAVYDTLNPNRIVIGGIDDRSGNMIEEFLRELHGSDLPPVLRVTPETAEIVKYASNGFLATKVAFINEMANLCEHFEAVDVKQVADGMGYDPRIGRAFLDAGLGFGGACLPKDLRALAEGAKRSGLRLRIAEATLASNESQPLRVIDMARELIGTLKKKRAAVLGLSFKPGTSDMREASSVRIVRALLDSGMHVSVYDPVAMENARRFFGRRVNYAKSVRDCLDGADCCFVVTEWNEFKTIPPELFLETMRKPVVIDGRRVIDPSKIDPKIAYRAIGLGRSRRN
jgi:UDPglucose 6-dehydrogenase